MRYIIIGNSAAAVGTIEGIRSVDNSGEIIVLSKEKYHTYSRPLISYYLNKKTDLKRMRYRDENFYNDNKIDFRPESEVISINKDGKTVKLSDGSELRYDKLMIATGSNPFVPNFKGLATVEKRFTFSSLDDALSLEKELSKEKNVLIIGAGLIGLKCAEGILDRVNKITVIDKSERILSSILDDEGSNIMKKTLVEKGLEFKLSSEIAHFEGNKAIFTDDEEINFDILVIAIGVRCNTALAKACNIETNIGIIINKKLETSAEDIYSAGDCSEGYDLITEKNRVLALLPNAYMQGEIAGKNMTGKETSYETGMAMNAIGFFGLHLLSAGIYQGECIVKKTEDTYKKLFFEDDKLKGFIIIGNCGRTGIYTSIIREKMPLSEMDFNLIIDKPQLIALNNKLLHKKLGENL